METVAPKSSLSVFLSLHDKKQSRQILGDWREFLNSSLTGFLDLFFECVYQPYIQTHIVTCSKNSGTAMYFRLYTHDKFARERFIGINSSFGAISQVIVDSLLEGLTNFLDGFPVKGNYVTYVKHSTVQNLIVFVIVNDGFITLVFHGSTPAASRNSFKSLI